MPAATRYFGAGAASEHVSASNPYRSRREAVDGSIFITGDMQRAQYDWVLRSIPEDFAREDDPASLPKKRKRKSKEKNARDRELRRLLTEAAAEANGCPTSGEAADGQRSTDRCDGGDACTASNFADGAEAPKQLAEVTKFSGSNSQLRYRSRCREAMAEFIRSQRAVQPHIGTKKLAAAAIEKGGLFVLYDGKQDEKLVCFLPTVADIRHTAREMRRKGRETAKTTTGDATTETQGPTVIDLTADTKLREADPQAMPAARLEYAGSSPAPTDGASQAWANDEFAVWQDWSTGVGHVSLGCCNCGGRHHISEDCTQPRLGLPGLHEDYRDHGGWRSQGRVADRVVAASKRLRPASRGGGQLLSRSDVDHNPLHIPQPLKGGKKRAREAREAAKAMQEAAKAARIAHATMAACVRKQPRRCSLNNRIGEQLAIADGFCFDDDDDKTAYQGRRARRQDRRRLAAAAGSHSTTATNRLATPRHSGSKPRGGRSVFGKKKRVLQDKQSLRV